jgi:hypothetical protein
MHFSLVGMVSRRFCEELGPEGHPRVYLSLFGEDTGALPGMRCSRINPLVHRAGCAQQLIKSLVRRSGNIRLVPNERQTGTVPALGQEMEHPAFIHCILRRLDGYIVLHGLTAGSSCQNVYAATMFIAHQGRDVGFSLLCNGSLLPATTESLHSYLTNGCLELLFVGGLRGAGLGDTSRYPP